MKTHYLFPNKYKAVGYVLFTIGLITGCIIWFGQIEIDSMLKTKVFAIFSDEFMGESQFFTFVENGILDELISVFIIIGGLLAAFSKQKDEDEFISKIRLESLVWSVYVNYGILLLAVLFVYGISFFHVLVFNMFTLIVFFLIRFNLKLRQIKS
jgi:hypothetical protein